MCSKVKIRESNIELLRIISIIFIILFHFVYKSNFQYNELTINNLLIKSFLFLGELGVNLFMLITGYYLSNSKISVKKIILLLFEVFFYNGLNCFIGYKFGYIDSFNDLSMIFPVITGRYWFITAYLLIYVLSSYFNKLIKVLSKREYQKLLLISLLIFSIIPTIFGLFYNSSEKFIFYNRFIWLAYIYFVGAYIRIYNIKILDSKKRSLFIAGITFLLMILSIVIIYTFRDTFFRIGTSETAYLWTPNNLFLFVLSVSVFMFFTKVDIKNNNIINKISSTTLGIYLLHDGVLSKYMWKDLFKSNIYIYSEYWLFYVLCSTFIIFITGILIDIIRQFLEKYSIKKIINLNMWKDVYIEIKSYGLRIVDKLL